MLFTEPGRVTERLILLGRPETCLTVVDGGDEVALLGGSMSYALPEIFEQLDRFGIDEKKIRWLVVLHAHFDHCGATPAMKRRWPWAKVAASARAAELLARPKVSGAIAAMDAAAAARYGRSQLVEEKKWSFDGLEVEETLADGDTLTVGDLSLKVLAVPGHSSCSIALWEPLERALFPSDAAGIESGEFFFTAGNSNIDQYLESLERMTALDVDILLREHYGGRTGADARASLERAMEDGRRTRDLLEEAWRAHRDRRAALEAVLDRLTGGAPEDFLPREVLSMVVGQMIGYVARKLGDG